MGYISGFNISKLGSIKIKLNHAIKARPDLLGSAPALIIMQFSLHSYETICIPKFKVVKLVT